MQTLEFGILGEITVGLLPRADLQLLTVDGRNKL